MSSTEEDEDEKERKRLFIEYWIRHRRRALRSLEGRGGLFDLILASEIAQESTACSPASIIGVVEVQKAVRKITHND